MIMRLSGLPAAYIEILIKFIKWERFTAQMCSSILNNRNTNNKTQTNKTGVEQDKLETE